MKIGYARVSTTEQDLERQIISLSDAGAVKIFQEKYTGSDFDKRDQLNEMLHFIREGDTLIVDALERLGRNYDQLLGLISSLELKKVKLVVLNMPLLNQPDQDDITSKLIRGIVIQVLAWVSEQNRLENKRTQAQGIALAKQKGIYKGKPREYRHDAPNPQKRLIYGQIVTMLYENVPISEIAKKTGVTRPTIYKIRNDITKIC